MSLSTNTDIESNITRSHADFSFADVVADLVGNPQYLNGYADYTKNIETADSFLWTALSAVGTLVGETLYSNVLNYIDVVSNIDLCKTKSLQSMVSLLGSRYSIFESLETMPLEIVNIIDVLSINKKYLLDANVLNDKLIDDLKTNVTTVISGDYSDLSNNTILSVIIDSKKYETYLSSVYVNLLSSNVYATYYPKDYTPNVYIYEKIANDLLDKQSEAMLSSNIFRTYKLQHGIPLEFNEEQIVNDIEAGLDSKASYSGYNLELINSVIAKRAEAYDVSQPTTRYKFYKEQKVKEYFKFIENKVYSGNEKFFQTPYNLNTNYLEVKSVNKKYLLIESATGLSIDNSMIIEVASILTNLTLYISELREKIKTQAQKNYMKGTFNLLSYVVNEYLIEFSKQPRLSKIPDELSSTPEVYLSAINVVRDRLKIHKVSDVNIVEYDDTTEYYNLRTPTTKFAKNKLLVNERYWEEVNPSAPASGLTLNQIENYYLGVLNMKDKVTDLDGFLKAVYSIGADAGYIDATTDKLVVQNENSAKVKQYQTDIFLNYSGTSIGYDPYYNYKNVTHSSYQIHPYLYGFVEHTGLSFPVMNAFFSSKNAILEDSTVKNNLSNYLGEFGQTINLWLNNSYDYSGYRTKYESSPHTSILNNLDKPISTIDYEGAFYPPAVKDFLARPDEAISSVANQTTTSTSSTFYEKYYAGLGLTPEEYKKIANQLTENYLLIKEVASTKQSEAEVYDIFKYGTDRYDNMYILYKLYSSATITSIEKENTPGQLWVRLRNHPIAMPALYGRHPILETGDGLINGKFKNIASDQLTSPNPMETDTNKMAYFYDMEFDTTKKILFLIDYPVNDIADHPELVGYNLPKNIQHSDIIVSVIDNSFDFISKCYQLKLLSDKDGDTDSIDNPKLVPSAAGKFDNFLFKGLYKSLATTNFVFVQNADPASNIAGLIVTLASYMVGDQVSLFSNLYLELTSMLDDFYIASIDAIKFSFVNDIITMAMVLARPSNTQLSVSNYFGAQTVYPLMTVDKPGEYNSFDSLTNFMAIADVEFAGFSFNILTFDIYNLNADASYIPQYPGKLGKNNIYLNGFYSKSPNNNIELLGYTNNKFETFVEYTKKKYGVTETEVDNVTDFSLDLSSLNEQIYGRVYQDYEDGLDNSLTISGNPLMTDGNSFYHPELKSFRYSIDITKALDSYNLSSIGMLLFNTASYSKNPYFMGKLDSLCDTADKINYSPKDIVINELSSTTLPGLVVTGSNNFFNNETSRAENNRLYNIETIQLSVDLQSTKKELVITLPLEDITKPTFVVEGLITCMVFNYDDLRRFRFYHYMDALGKVKDGKINGIPLSAIELSSYTTLSSVPGLSGYSNLDFKYDEEQIFNRLDDQWYYPGMNTTFPFRTINLIDFLTTAGDSTLSGGTESILSGAFSGENLFLNQLENDNIINSIGEMYLPIINNPNNCECILAFEDYIQNISKYNTKDPRVLEYVNFCSGLTPTTSAAISVDIPIEYISANDADGFASKYLSSYIILQSEANDEKLDIGVQVYDPTNDIKLAEYLNLYMNYVKQNNNITLYFNYCNFLNSPFLKVVDGKQKLDIIPRSYLKLEAGQDGYLDIIIQFKKYAKDGTIELYRNVTLVTYHIFNISDDKPKYLIYNESKISKNSIKFNKPATTVQFNFQSSKKVLDKFTDKPIDFTTNVKVIADRNILSASFAILFDFEELAFVSSPVPYEVLGEGYILISASNINNKFINVPLNFSTTLTDRELIKDNKLIYNFGITNPQAIDKDNNIPKYSTINGTFQLSSTVAPTP